MLPPASSRASSLLQVPVAVHATSAPWTIAAGHLTTSGKPNRAALRRMFAGSLEERQLVASRSHRLAVRTGELGEMERAHAARASLLSDTVSRMVRGGAAVPEGSCAPLTSLAAVRLAAALRVEVWALISMCAASAN